MAWKEVIFVREALYEEVWKDPVSKVAPRYGLSDVGLRKICKKLRVPLPPLGYWAKLQYGKHPARAILPKADGPQQYRHSRYVVEPDEELTQRLQTARAELSPPPAGVEIHMHTAVGDCHPIVRRMASRLRSKVRDSRDWPAVGGQGVMAMSVSTQHQDRALLLLDSILQRCLGARFRVLTPKEQNAPAQVDVDGEKFTFRISEKSGREERDLTPSERRDAELYPALYGGRKYYLFKATGILQLEVTQVGSSYPIFSIRDGKTELLEEKTANLASRLKDHSLQLRVARELAQDRAKQAEVRRAEQRKLAERREAELEKLKKLEAAATEWDRAQRLRRFAAALAAATAVEGGKELAEWIHRAADWLDPLVKTRWAEVDDAPAHVW